MVDAILAKRNLGTAITDAPVVLALGPGFTAGVDCHGVVETMRGHNLGRLLTQGSAAPNTGVPGDVGLHHPAHHPRPPRTGRSSRWPPSPAGWRRASRWPGLAGRTACAQLTGVVRGMLPAGLAVTAGIEGGGHRPPVPGGEHCFTVSDKARAIGGGVLEGLLILWKEGGSMERLILCGGGHVSLEVAHIARRLEFELVVIDDRSEFASPGALPHGRPVVCRPFLEALDAPGQPERAITM